MSIRLRLILGFAIVIGAMVCLTMFALLQMKDTKDRVDSIVDVSIKKVEIAQKLKKDLLHFTVLEKNVLLVPDPEEKKAFMTELMSFSRPSKTVNILIAGAMNARATRRRFS